MNKNAITLDNIKKKCRKLDIEFIEAHEDYVNHIVTIVLASYKSETDYNEFINWINDNRILAYGIIIKFNIYL